MVQKFYRFRSAPSLLDDFHELERQEIYFSRPGQLNDPLEGHMNLVWQGDEALWRNLMRHYLLCLLQTFHHMAMQKTGLDLEHCSNFVWGTDEDLPKGEFRTIFEDIAAKFLAEPAPVRIIEHLSAARVALDRDGLISYLHRLHPLALKVLIEDLEAREIVAFDGPGFETVSRYIPIVLDQTQLERDLAQRWAMDGAPFSASSVRQRELGHDLKKELAGSASWQFIWRDMAANYVDALPRLMFPAWSTACFVRIQPMPRCGGSMPMATREPASSSARPRTRKAVRACRSRCRKGSMPAGWG